MNCTALRREMLRAERPDRPAPAAAAHLAGCAGCRAFLERLLLAERLAADLPVPSAERAKAALLARLGREPAPARAPAPRRSIALVLGSWILDPHAAPARRVAAGLVAGLAAAVMLLFVGLMIWFTRLDPARPGGVLALDVELRRHDIRLPEGGTPRQRLAALAGAADEIRGRGERLAHSRPDELPGLARLYDRVLREGLLPDAEQVAAGLPADERPAVLDPLVRQLTETESLARRLGAEPGLSTAGARALEQMAVASLEGKERLLRLRAAL